MLLSRRVKCLDLDVKKFMYIGVGIMLLRFFKISHLLERVLMEHIDMKNNLDSKLQLYSVYSIRILSRKLDIFEKPQQLNSNPCMLSVYKLFLYEKTLFLRSQFV